MTAIFLGLPLQAELNIARYSAWQDTYKNELIGKRAASCLVHKELTAICLITNTASIGIGATGFAFGAVVLGTPKLLVFICTAGNVRPKYSTGCIYSMRVIGKSISQIFWNTLEVTYDCGYVGYKCGKTIHWTAKQLGFDGALRRAVEQVFIVIGKGADQVVRGAARAAKREPAIGKGSPFIVAWINEPTKDLRINFGTEERSVASILSHFALSIVNVPVNVVAFGGAGAGAIVLTTAFAGKVALNSIINCDIPGSTFAGTASVVAGKSLFNVAADLGTIAADTGVLFYKGANVLRINAIMATAIEFLYWSVGAIFS